MNSSENEAPMTAAAEEQNEPTNKKKNIGKLVGIAVVLVVVVLIARLTGLSEYVSLDGLNRLRDWILSFGLLAPIIFIFLYALATVAFLPGTPLSLLAGLVFGPVFGTLWIVIGATIGATLAFLIGRYAARDLVDGWTANNERIRKLDEGVERQGWRMLLITRLVPVFPFNLQNYAYGLTKIKLLTYVGLTSICIIPGAAVYAFAGGSLANAREDLTTTFIYLGVAAVLFVIISFIPRWLQNRKDGQPNGKGG
ncbi:MAG: TVP38/TMEM64 family protein [Actinomycetota bacterium]|nr:TVP38/TMEM64 family protein [Actinomycetota bacterium]